MSNPVRKLVIVALLLAAPPMAVAQQKLDIVQIMGQFVQANYAANKCLNPDQATLSRFNANLTIVSARASEEMLKRNPGVSAQQVAVQLQKGTAAVEKRIDEIVAAKGCSDPQIEDLLKRFAIQANLKF